MREESRREESGLGAAAVSHNSNTAIPAIPMIIMLCVKRRCTGIAEFYINGVSGPCVWQCVCVCVRVPGSGSS